MAEQPSGDPASSLGDEVARIVGLVQNWARESFPAPAGRPEADGHTHASDCDWCPLCQFAAVLRGERPEVTERVAEAGAAIASAFRSLLDSARPAPPSADEGAPRVQRIDLGGDDADRDDADRDDADPDGDADGDGDGER